MHTKWIPLFLLAILIVASCESDDPSLPTPYSELTTDELVIADCYELRDAMEAFASENSGVYPVALNDQSSAGNAFVTYLPGDVRLTNRYTGLATAPVFQAPAWPGEIGVVFFENYHAPTGYRIVGRGRDGELLRLENFASVDGRAVTASDSVLMNVNATVAAADEFKRQAGRYASDLAGDDLPSGEVMVDFLPGGVLLMNPYSGLRADPVDGTSTGIPGGVGYVAHDRDGDGWWDGYLIDATGGDYVTMILSRTATSPEDEEVIGAVLALRWAVEEFANSNGGEYPSDVDAVQEAAGVNVNPYTGASAFRNGLATSRGEVGYVPVEENGAVVGYIINAWGLFEEIERFEVGTGSAN